jgi:LmbE family N-acetylglucosaminyl deacetylase
MKNNPPNRRSFVKNISLGLGGLSLPSFIQSENNTVNTPLKVVCVGGHPDDPESGCGGTLAKLSQSGHSVTIIYLTTGEAGITGKTNNEAAAIRKQEALKACSVLKAKAIFAGQIDGDTIVNNEWHKKISALLLSEEPDIVFTHWPIDSHKDHQAASLLTIQARIHSAKPFDLYFFEVCAGEQTMTFHPTDYVDISDTQSIKKQAVYCHVSQDPPGIYNCGHASMEEFRGRELGVKAAEAFVRMNGKKMGGFKI